MIFSSLKRRISRLRKQDEHGSILILVVLSALMIFGSAGLAVDVGRLYATKAELSRTVDAAALAGVLEFNGTETGLTNAGNKAEEYLQENRVGNETLTVVKSVAPYECKMIAASAACVVADGGQRKLSINARKQIRLFFLPIFGKDVETVSAKATAGFNDQTVDAVMVLDSTYSMNGAPLANAKAAAISFKNTLLGTNSSDNVYVGVAPLRGCYRPTPITFNDCVYNTRQTGTTYVQELTKDRDIVESAINSATSGGMSATNVCTGLGKGYEVLTGTNPYADGHAGANNRRVLVLLSDGDNVYFGENVYQASPASPNTFDINGPKYACAPPDVCTSWGGTPCRDGTDPGERDGYRNGNDGQDPASCDETPKPRERQLDVATLNIANAIKAQNVEIFVVSFSACPNQDGTKVYNNAGNNTCTSQSNPISSAPASGTVGDTTTERTANTRLVKCIASSTPGTNDHFWYATDAKQLPSIFTTIAAQIAHRLTE